MNAVYVLITGVAMFVFAGGMISLFVDESSPEILRVGVTYLRVMAGCYLFCSLLSAMQGFFRGVGLVKITMIATMLQMGVRCLLALILVPRLEIWGVCISVIAGWLAVCMFMDKLRKIFQAAGQKAGGVSDGKALNYQMQTSIMNRKAADGRKIRGKICTDGGGSHASDRPPDSGGDEGRQDGDVLL